LQNVAIRIEDTDDRESFLVKGRGEFQMAIIIETMRREGFELTVGRPEVIYKKDDGKITEPIERVYVDCDETFMGIVTEKLSIRKGRMVNLVNNGKGRVRISSACPRAGSSATATSVTDTKGTGYELLPETTAVQGFPTRFAGSIVATAPAWA
jgi:GTP-binding protein